MSETDGSFKLVYGPDDKPKSMKETILYSAQWIFIMFYPVVWGYSIVGLGLQLKGDDMANYMARVVLMIGVCTLVQAIAGHRLSMVSGPNIIPSLAIVAAFAIGGKEYALQSFNAYIIAGIVVAILGWFRIISIIGKVWTPLVLGSMVMMVGLTTSTVGVGLIASYGATAPFYVGILLALICGFISIKGRGILATIPVLIAIVLGYVVFMAMGKFDWGLVQSMPFIMMPTIFPYGLSMPPIDLIITMIIVNIFSAINLYGNVQGYTGIIGVKTNADTERRYFTTFGVIEGMVASVFGVPSCVSYGENLGLVLLTRVAARIFIVISSIAFIVLSFFGQIGGLMAAMPQPVAGAVLLGVASTLIGTGASIWTQGNTFQTREIFIGGFSVFLALGLAALPQDFYNTLPNLVGTVMKNNVIMVIILTMIMEQVVFRNKPTVSSSESIPENA
ncbi:MAG TPA: solute carrier family 23 protein [Selenomonadales bacterium]|nr:solute carrier family 23 protein [Selenomonadales bacterium]